MSDTPDIEFDDGQLRQTPQPILYLLMRTDLDSLNPGKAIAQGAHGANACVHRIQKAGTPEQRALLQAWQAQCPDDGCGVTLSLAIPTGDQLAPIVEMLKAAGVAAGVFTDPSYPIQDGAVCHTLPLVTCAWALAEKHQVQPALGGFDLHA